MKLRLPVSLALAGLFGLGLAACHPAGTVVDDDGQSSGTNCNGTSETVPTTIQGGIDAAAAGSTIKVCPGNYPGNVIVNKPMNLQGAQVNVDGSRAVTVANESRIFSSSGAAAGKLDITADNVTVNGFLFEGVDDSDALHVTATTTGADVRNNVFRNNVFGLYLNGNGDNKEIVVTRNLFANNNASGSSSGNGIYSDQGLNTAEIFSNTFSGNANAGILLAGGLPIENVLVRNNTSTNDATFVNMFGSSHITVRNNTVNDTNPNDNANQGSQVRVENVNGVSIRDNTFTNSAFSGIAVRGDSANVDMLGNNVSGASEVDAAGIDVTSTHSGAASEVRSNTTNNNTTGIKFGSATRGTFISNNTASGNGTDCVDASVGSQRAGVGNVWATDNIGSTSSPAGLCHP